MKHGRYKWNMIDRNEIFIGRNVVLSKKKNEKWKMKNTLYWDQSFCHWD